ncbi:hypothetical protein T11_2586 [Trichinella zimbabwensis]|uniref:Uncharacterized protein n=1 Tax=Trichinella zimbabwensis TaxID=268475 RepID=A0A0V1I5M4_9BILA|nr:hypothetical protein T11_2586 [Trichinella zimbabwensis]
MARLSANVASAEHFDIGRCGGSFSSNVQRSSLQQQRKRNVQAHAHTNTQIVSLENL